MSHNCLWIDCLHHIHTFTPATNEWTSERTNEKQTNKPEKNGENGTKWTIFFPNEIIMKRFGHSSIENHTFHFFDLIPLCASTILFTDIFWRVSLLMVAIALNLFVPFCSDWRKKYGRSTKAEPQNEWSAVYHISNWPLCWINSIERLFSYEELSVDWPSVFISQHHCCLVTMLCIFAFIFVCKHTHTDKQSESRWQNRVAAAAKKSR